MKFFYRTAVLVALAIAPLSSVSFAQSETEEVAPKLTLTTDNEKASYAIGMEIGSQLRQLPDGLDAKIIMTALQSALNGDKLALTEEEAMAAQQAFMMKMQQQQQEEIAAMGEKNSAEGEAFLAANKEKEGVVTTDSGLQYSIVEAGEGENPTAADTVTVHYEGTMLDGSIFDSSMQRGEPATFPLGNVIPGWTEGLQLMKPGAKYRFWIPSDLAYGPRGNQGIPPNSTLVFDVELISIASQEEAAN